MLGTLSAMVAPSLAALPVVAAPAVNKGGSTGNSLAMRFFPYELQLRHAFNLAKYSRTTTPDVQVEITIDGITAMGRPRCLHISGNRLSL